MSVPLYNNDDDDAETMQQKQLRFYALIGLCISSYQSIEDRLEDVFKSCLKMDAAAASGIFSVAKGLEDRCRLITSAMLTRNSNLQGLWDDLRKRIKLSADKRNQIAHATSVFVGRGVVIDADENGDHHIIGFTKPHSEMNLEKKTPSGMARWDMAMLRAEHEDLHELSRNMTVLFRILEDGKLDRPFDDWWKHPLIEGAIEG